VTAQAADLDALVGPRFARAVWLVIADPETGEWTASSNADNAEAASCAGAKVADEVLALGVEAIITGHIGPAAHNAFEEAGVPVYHADNGVTVRDALSLLAARKLEVIDAPTVAGHWSPPPKGKPKE